MQTDYTIKEVEAIIEDLDNAHRFGFDTPYIHVCDFTVDDIVQILNKYVNLIERT